MGYLSGKESLQRKQSFRFATVFLCYPVVKCFLVVLSKA